MPDRPHIVLPGDVTSSFATSEELTGDAAHLAALMSTARSRMVIATTSPDTSQCRQALIWMQPGPCVVTRTATAPTGDIETHIYQIDNEEIPHVAAAISTLAPNPAIFDGPPVLPTAIVYAAQQGMTEETAQLLENYSSYGPSDSAFAQALVAQRWAYTTWIREDCTDEDSFVPTTILSTLITPAASYRIEAPLLAPSTGPHIPIHPIYNTQLWALLTQFFALSPERNQP